MDDCNYFKKMVEISRIFKFLIGLNVEFDEVRGKIIGRQPLPSLGEVFSIVCHEESRRNVMHGKKLSRPVKNSALLGTATAASHNPNNQHRSDDKLRVCVIIVINHATLVKPTGNYMGSKLIGSSLNGRLISKATLIVSLLKHMLSRHPH